MVEMEKLEDESVDLILTDPPYGTIKGMEVKKKGRVTSKRNDWDEVVDIEMMMREFHRVLKPKGRAIIFGNNGYTQDLRNSSNTYMRYIYPLYWVKNTYGSPLTARVAPLSYVEDLTVFYKTYGKNKRQREYMEAVFDYIGKGRDEIAKDLGIKRTTLDRCWHEDVQFRLPPEERYDTMDELYGLNSMEGYKTFDELLAMKAEESPGSVFNIQPGKGHVSNVFFVSKEWSGGTVHPTQKPVDLMEQLIEIYSNEGDVVLDAFMGSGTTGIACQNTNRDFIGIEMDDEYFELSQNRLRDNNK